MIVGLLIVDKSIAVPSVLASFGNEASVCRTGLGKILRKSGDSKWSIVIIGTSDLERRRRDLTSDVHSVSTERYSGG